MIIASLMLSMHLSNYSMADTAEENSANSPTPEQWIKLNIARELADRIAEMAAGMTEFRGLVHVVGNRDRLLIICQLHEGRKSEQDLARSIGIRREDIVSQLRNLQDMGIIRTRRDHGEVYYVPASAKHEKFMRNIYSSFCSSLVDKCERDDLPYR
jgi:DNA-binding HxlR family transcriptional regulator